MDTAMDIISWMLSLTSRSVIACTWRDQSSCAPSQWETSLQCNDVSHWLGAHLDWSLHMVWSKVNQADCRSRRLLKCTQNMRNSRVYIADMVVITSFKVMGRNVFVWIAFVSEVTSQGLQNQKPFKGTLLSLTPQVPVQLVWMFTHCGLVTSHGDRNLGQHWLRLWVVAWWHQAVTWTNVD